MWSEPHLTQLNSLMKLLVPFVILEHVQIFFLCFKYYFTEFKKSYNTRKPQTTLRGK